MATITSTRHPRLRIQIVGLEIILMGVAITVLALSDLPALVPLFTFPALVVHSVLFYQIGRVRERLETQVD